MSVSYAVEVILNISYNRENILKIFEKGKILEVMFFAENSNDNQQSVYMTCEQATDVVLSYNSTIFCDIAYLISAKMEDVYFLIRINEQPNNMLSFALEGIGSSGERKFFNSGNDVYHVNFDRYIRFLLKWCAGFPIKRFYTTEY